jgi:hypothetical protein
MAGIGFAQNGREKFAGPGHWNDPDMLVVGQVGWGNLHPTNLTPNEQYTHISLWCLLCAPLLIGCDMSQLDDFTLNLLTNDEVLEVNQDPLGNRPRVAQVNTEVWAKTGKRQRRGLVQSRRIGSARDGELERSRAFGQSSHSRSLAANGSWRVRWNFQRQGWPARRRAYSRQYNWKVILESKVIKL